MEENAGLGPAGSINGGERTPLLSQRRLFRSLSGAGGGGDPEAATFRESSVGSWYRFRNVFQRSQSNVSVRDTPDSETPSHRTLGTLTGVFCPVALSMFSALLFLRIGYLIGHAGLLEALLQFAIAYVILVFTVTSVCAISTNGAIEGGGCYFMISRTLGPELGGSVGTLFCLANVVSSALYLTGCAEGLVENFGPSGYLVDGALPDGRWWRFLYASSINLLNVVVCLIGAAAFARMSAAILAIVVVCLVSVIVSFLAQPFMEIPIPEANHLVQNSTLHVNGTFTGLSAVTLQDNLFPNYGPDYTAADSSIVTFATVFGVLFSGVTGIMAGANMSGELKDPGKSIPRGTLSAVGFTCCIYILLSLLTAATCSPFLLKNDYLFMMGINVWKPFVTIGIVAATWSASLSNLIGSSRVLAALARDDIFGILLSPIVKGTYKSNPWLAVLVVGALVTVCLLMGSLNVIAQLNSVLFLLSYCVTNLACLLPELSSAPNFRPTFNLFSWHTALIGLVGTLVMMFVINAVYASVSLLLCLVLLIALHLFSPARTANWGSISQAIIFHQVRKYLLLLDSRKDHVKFWRPQMLLMVSNPRSAVPLIGFVNALKKSGLYVLGHVKTGRIEESKTDPSPQEYSAWLDLIDRLKIKAFVEVTVAPTVREGMHHLIRLSGLGAMKPNTIVLGFYDDEVQMDLLSREEALHKSGSISSFQIDEELYPLRGSGTQRAMTEVDYVNMIVDVVRLQKNVCLCRNFYLLDLNLIQKQKKTLTIDVWPVNFFSDTDTHADEFDTSTLFQLQLACILNMVAAWKDLELRVFMCDTQGSSGDTRDRELCLRHQLKQLRIKARTSIVSLPTLPNDLGKAAKVNAILRENSASAAVVFLYLPLPGETSSPDLSSHYLSMLATLTDSLPPTLLVHGVSPVTSTNL